MMLKKLNDKGVYTEFPGLTVVAAVKESDNEFWSKIHKMVIGCDILGLYYAPLSNASYHMTAMNLYTEKQIGRKEWKEFVLSNRSYFRMIRDDFEQHLFNPQITIESLEVGRTIKLVVSLPEEQKNQIIDIAQRFNLIKKIPHPFHITLAYRYKHCDPKIETNLKNELNNSLEQLLSVYQRTFLLNSSQLCFFNDMNAFIPWDCCHVPF